MQRQSRLVALFRRDQRERALGRKPTRTSRTHFPADAGGGAGLQSRGVRGGPGPWRAGYPVGRRGASVYCRSPSPGGSRAYAVLPSSSRSSLGCTRRRLSFGPEGGSRSALLKGKVLRRWTRHNVGVLNCCEVGRYEKNSAGCRDCWGVTSGWGSDSKAKGLQIRYRRLRS